ncbi:multicopper oxidase [Polychaeton citri CBS 116435]|uniref:laccase n=1 Tax=Polychaeton citri CBS 116435 TaxID=1314669 RepID=A0A9P4QK26_9PEZI|nr:multicopper oxidase [Polychaeton citri CBS 116435]
MYIPSFFRLVAFATAIVASAIPAHDVLEPTTTLVERQSNAGNTVAVLFKELVTTSWGQMVFIVGNVQELGSWNPSNGVALSASNYTNANPLWYATVNLQPGAQIQYKYVIIHSDNTVQWEADPDHYYTVPNDGSKAAEINNKWQQPTATQTATPTPACTNSATSRGCWTDGYDIDTDFDKDFPTTGKTVYYDFKITNTTLAPDGFKRQVFAINGKYPGPTIYANWGDMISVTVHNQMKDNGTTIHWHGVRQWHNNGADGVPGVTECPIAPGKSKTYTFQATQYGTSWYHSHFSCQYGDGILGSIVIYGPATANYDVDLGPLPVTDWYYPTVNLHAARAEHQNALPPEADNALLNGTMVSNSGGKYSRSTLQTGKKHRVRLINMSVDNHFMMSLDGHQLTVIEADFVPIIPYNTTWIFLGIGQRYDVIINANQAPGSYWFRAEVQDQAGCGTNFANGNILSIFSYTGHTTETPISQKTSYTQRCTDETKLVPYWNSYVPTGSIPDFNVMTTNINNTNNPDGSISVFWNVNGSALDVAWDQPTLKYVKDGNTNYPSTANLIQLPTEDKWTYWVIQGLGGSPFTVEVPHPIHLHGHDFYVLGTGQGRWADSNRNSLNYKNPTRRDVAMLPQSGWLALAFQTDNPGAWIMHCHIAWHADEGLAVQFLEARDQIQSVSPYPSDFDSQCSAWDAYQPKAAYAKHDSGI